MSDIKKKESEAFDKSSSGSFGRHHANTLSELTRIPGVQVKQRKK